MSRSVPRFRKSLLKEKASFLSAFSSYYLDVVGCTCVHFPFPTFSIAQIFVSFITSLSV